ncbi:MAG: hypothetical protein ABW214_00250 [Terrimicrobiaceae bacterium]
MIHGASARGLAIDTAAEKREEEFPQVLAEAGTVLKKDDHLRAAGRPKCRRKACLLWSGFNSSCLCFSFSKSRRDSGW